MILDKMEMLAATSIIINFSFRALALKKYQVIIKNVLVREYEDHHDVIITCQDKGSRPLMTEIMFSVKVTDINDYITPVFKKDFYFFHS